MKAGTLLLVVVGAALAIVEAVVPRACVVGSCEVAAGVAGKVAPVEECVDVSGER